VVERRGERLDEYVETIEEARASAY
jgi:hypothetical protein